MGLCWQASATCLQAVPEDAMATRPPQSSLEKKAFRVLIGCLEFHEFVRDKLRCTTTVFGLLWIQRVQCR